MLSTWSELTQGLSEGELALFSLYRAFCRELPGDGFDEALRSLIEEASETVGPGLRAR